MELNSLFIAEVKSKIFSRLEYTQYKRINIETQLWMNDPLFGNDWRWNRVFEFDKLKVIDDKINMHELNNNPRCKNFVVKTLEVVCFGKSREISLKDYQNLLEAIV